MDNGIVRDWETMDAVLKYGFNKLFDRTYDHHDKDGKESNQTLKILGMSIWPVASLC